MELTDVQTADLGLAQQLALARLQLFMVGETHKLLMDLDKSAAAFFSRLNQDQAIGTANHVAARSTHNIIRLRCIRQVNSVSH